MPKDSGSSKKKKVAPAIDFYRAPHIEPTQTHATEIRRYTQLAVDSAGRLSAKHSHLSIDVGAKLLLESSNEASNWDTIEDHAMGLGVDANDTYGVDNEDSDEEQETDPLLDPQYQEHLKESGQSEKIKRFREAGDESIRDFAPQASLFLSELIALDSRGSNPSNLCAECQIGSGEYQCLECDIGREMICQDCIVQRHKMTYLHLIQKWVAPGFFVKQSLKDLGLRVQLGHLHNDMCGNPIECPGDDFVIVHSNGVHNIGLDFCGCGNTDQKHTTQLLRARLFPATVSNPKTAATIKVLELYEILSYESKCSPYEFFWALSRLTDNIGLDKPKDRYPSFVRMAHEWRHLMMLKRAGRGHCARGLSGTKEGECAVLCPACPQPGKNMDAEWKNRPKHLRFLDALFVAIDANFRHKRQDVSSHKADPGLSAGFAYFVEETSYQGYLKQHETEVEPKSTCSRHDAVNLSERKPGQGYVATGIAAVVCARHDMKRPNSVAQLQRGERYCNMDYVVYKSTKNDEVLYVILSYDIACQWYIHFRSRMAAIDKDFYMLNDHTKVRFLVPKFHLPAHISKCRTQFSFNFTKDVGRTDGEAPERGWSTSNKMAPSTRQMGPGSCRDTLDYHFGDENHKKVVGLGRSLLKKIKVATEGMMEHTIVLSQLESTLLPEALDGWRKEIEEWEEDSTKPNPFEREIKAPSQAAVRRQMADDERRDLEQGINFSLDTTVTQSVLIAMGIDLESEQRSLRVLNSKIWDHSLDRQHTKLILRGNTLIRKIEAWIQYQILYMPCVSRLRQEALEIIDHTIPAKPQNINLWLPSLVGNKGPVSQELRQTEFDLRIPQAREALAELRRQLQLRAHVFKFKKNFSRGQGANTRANNTIETVQGRVNAAANEYRDAYTALLALSPYLGKTSWKTELRPLLASDIRDLSEGKEKQSEGTRDISWIWLVTTAASSRASGEETLQDGVRLEWAQSRARAHRFQEEVALVSEEMMRVLTFFSWKSSDWIGRASFCGASSMHSEGIAAYAWRQSQMYKDLSAHFQNLWKEAPTVVMQAQATILQCSQ